MPYTIPTGKVVNYEPEAMRSFHVYGFEWIDNLLFLRDPEPFVGSRLGEYVAVVKERFDEYGWDGNGEVGLLWLPPFVFPLNLNTPPTGVVLWHVKQEEDGISFLLSPIPLPFEEFSLGER